MEALDLLMVERPEVADGIPVVLVVGLDLIPAVVVSPIRSAVEEEAAVMGYRPACLPPEEAEGVCLEVVFDPESSE